MTTQTQPVAESKKGGDAPCPQSHTTQDCQAPEVTKAADKPKCEKCGGSGKLPYQYKFYPSEMFWKACDCQRREQAEKEFEDTWNGESFRNPKQNAKEWFLKGRGL